MSSPLELSHDARTRLGREALELVLRWFEDAARTPIYPRVAAEALKARFDEPLPREPGDASAVIDAVAARIAPAGRNNNHPRMFGYVASPAEFTAVLGDFLASALNQNVTSWRSSPGATTIEHVVIRWMAEMVGYPTDAGGLLVSGGSMANLTGLVVALRSQAGVDLNRDGLRALRAEPVFYASPLVHMSIGKALQLLGLGHGALTKVRVTDALQLDVSALEQAIAADRAAGKLPVAVVANAGDVNAGVVDPLAAIVEVCARHGVWCHVDGAYGGFAAMATSAAPLFAGLSRVDSLSLDPHKWLFAPIDAGCLLVRDSSRLSSAFVEADDYVSVLGGPSDFAYWDRGLELSRRFRALKIWMMLKTHGASRFAATIDANLRQARALAALVDAAPDFERLAPVPLGIVCFRYVPPALRAVLASGDPEGTMTVNAELDRLNRAIAVEIQRGGYETYVSNTTMAGAFALRCCLTNYRTTDDDLPLVLEAVRDAARHVWPST
ncbi:MAG: aminotransferase class I/II-fold pyridoxal phosphate-dependent enzyme [Vicinamibacterales bacterium]